VEPALATSSAAAAAGRFQAFDLLATLVAVVRSNGAVVFANSVLEDALGISRRMLLGASLPDSFLEPLPLRHALAGASSNEYAALRYDAWLKRLNREPLPVHVIVAQSEGPDEFIVELLPLQGPGGAAGGAGPGQQRADS
jgi:two-component system nitrogen regulation sensor histidine kinase GlnL